MAGDRSEDEPIPADEPVAADESTPEGDPIPAGERVRTDGDGRDEDRADDDHDPDDRGQSDDAGRSQDAAPSGEGTDEGAEGLEPDRADAPLGDLATSVDERRGRDRERVDDELFSREEVPEIDTDVVWERIDEDGPVGPVDGEGDVRVVEKDAYCENCPYFSPPPAVACSHEGTRILELVDLEHFRVVDCPKVVETERLERL